MGFRHEQGICKSPEDDSTLQHQAQHAAHISAADAGTAQRRRAHRRAHTADGTEGVSGHIGHSLSYVLELQAEGAGCRAEGLAAHGQPRATNHRHYFHLRPALPRHTPQGRPRGSGIPRETYRTGHSLQRGGEPRPPASTRHHAGYVCTGRGGRARTNTRAGNGSKREGVGAAEAGHGADGCRRVVWQL